MKKLGKKLRRIVYSDCLNLLNSLKTIDKIFNYKTTPLCVDHILNYILMDNSRVFEFNKFGLKYIVFDFKQFELKNIDCFKILSYEQLITIFENCYKSCL